VQWRRSGGADAADGKRGPRRVSRNRRVPVGWLLLYYVVIIALAVAVAMLVPIARHAFVAPVQAPTDVGNPFTDGLGTPPVAEWTGPFDRAIVTLCVILGGLALALPIAWVAMFTRRVRYDPSLVQSIIILPVVVAGIVILVKNSLALAFSLAGIVAVVRFRNTLKDPKDAVYIFLVLGVGLAAGVQALDVALLVSMAFNLLVLGLWKFDVGGLYSAAGQSGLLTIGDLDLLPLGGSRELERVREEAMQLSKDIDVGGYLLVVAADVTAARRCLEITLTEFASKWRAGEPSTLVGGLASFVVVVDLRDKRDPLDLLGELDERWPQQIAAAEYVPFWREGRGDGED
jgi:hypothetical protein